MKNFKTFMMTAILYNIINIAIADSWTITQTFSITGGDLELTQTRANGATQTVNLINLDNGSVTQATQTVNMNSRNLEMTQENGTQNSHQAINRISANSIIEATQSVLNVRTTQMTQKSSTGNTQALNDVEARTLNKLTQTITGRTIEFNQNSTINNIQAGNLIQADRLSHHNITQNFTVDTLTQNSRNGGRDNIQAANAAIGMNATQVRQNANVGTWHPSGGSGVTQTLNYTQIR
ncbi:MAG: hypothetical protein ABFS56_25520 [Pseudomonadota bacterium]